MGFLSKLFKTSQATPRDKSIPPVPSDGPQLERAMELAGFFAAHAVLCVSTGETLIPMGAAESPTGQRQLQRFVCEQIEDGAAQGQAWLEANAERAARAVLIVDGFVSLEDGKTDALIVTVREHALGEPDALWVIPYRHAEKPGGFAVYRPKLRMESASRATDPRLGEAFWRGVDAHRDGAAVWNKHIDQGR